MGQAWLGLFDGISFDPKGQVLGLGQAVVALGQLGAQHLGVLGADGIVAIVLRRDPDALFKTLLIRCHVDEGHLEMNRAVKEIQKAAPFLKDGLLILLLSQLIVDVLVLNGFCVVAPLSRYTRGYLSYIFFDKMGKFSLICKSDMFRISLLYLIVYQQGYVVGL